jgi:putative peptidoglycan lipid II flippase
MARNTAIFSALTGLSRVAGLGREIVASSYFATSGAFSAFTIAFQVPNVVRSLFADAALSAAFVPVFTELLEEDRKQDAFKLASTLFWMALAVLGALTAFFILTAGIVMPVFTGPNFEGPLDDLTVGLSRILFPILVLLGINGLLVGILNAYDHFSIQAISPLVWNVVILIFLVGMRPFFDGDDQLYAYAIGVLIGTCVQVAMAVPQLRRLGFRIHFEVNWRDERVRQVLQLMLPVCIGLGLINFNLLVNSVLGALVSEEAPRAIDAAFRIYMLPQGMFSVAVATVLYPALSRFAARRDHDGLRALTGNGFRQIFLLLVPAAAAIIALSTPITRLVYEHGEFGPGSTDLVSTALFWFSFSLPFSGVNLLLTRTFFSLQKPWTTTKLAAANLLVNIVVSAALYKPFGIAGIVVGTAASSAFMTFAQAYYLRRLLGGRLEGRKTLDAILRICVASAGLGITAYFVWWGLDDVFGRALVAQVASVGTALTAGVLVYTGLVMLLRVPEAAQIERMFMRRLQRA